MALTMVGCGCAAPAPAPSPSWKQVQSARIPSQCGHPPTKLVKGKHTGIIKGRGMFELLRTLYSGKSGVLTNVPSSAGPVTAVVADCHQGGVSWEHRILFFGPGAKFVAATDLSGGNWERQGLTGPARNGVQSMTRTASGLSLDVLAYRPWDGGCCAGGRATVKVKISGGKVSITSITRR